MDLTFPVPTDPGCSGKEPVDFQVFVCLSNYCRELCSTFARYFVDKIAKLPDSVSDKLRVLSASVPSDMSFSLYDGPVLDTLPPVTADEVTRVLSLSLIHI